MSSNKHRGSKSRGRVGIHLDMTPMVDIAFLLLIFYMATTQFKPPERQEVKLPASQTEEKLPKQNLFTITVPDSDTIFIDYVTTHRVTDPDGAVYDQPFRKAIAVCSQDVKSSGSYLQSMRLDEIKHVKEIFGSDKERIEAVLNWPVIIKADRAVNYGIMEDLMESLRDINIPTFKIMTEYEQS